MPLPGSNIFGQTFFKVVDGVPEGAGKYQYTSELEELRRNQGVGKKKVLFGYFHPQNEHAGSTDDHTYDRVKIEGSTFGRDILHCKESRQFHPWSVIERWERSVKDAAVDFDVYLMYGMGDEFILMGAGLMIETATYDEADRTRDALNPKWTTIYKQPLVFPGQVHTQFYNQKVATVKLLPEQMTGKYNAFRISIYAQFDNPDGVVPLMKDIYLEGFCMLDQTRLTRTAPPKCECNIF